MRFPILKIQPHPGPLPAALRARRGEDFYAPGCAKRRPSALKYGLFLSAFTFIATCLAASAESPKPDGGKFTLLLNGKSVGTDVFRMLPEGCDSDVSISIGTNPAVTFHQTLKFKNGRWGQVTTDAGGVNHFTLTLSGDKSMLKVADRPASGVKLPALVYPFGNSSPHLFAYVISAYDAKKGGEQKFDTVFSEGVGPTGPLVVTTTLKAPETATKQVKGKPVAISRYQAIVTGPSGPIAMEVITDKARHILFWNVPAQKYAAVREGFQELAADAGRP